MADFALDPQVMQAQNYLNWSKPITNVPAKETTADTSASYLGKAIGTGIEGGAELADSTIKGVLKNYIYAKVDPLRDAYTASLEAIKAGQAADPAAQPDGNKTIPNVGWAQSTAGYSPQSLTPQSLIPDAQGPMPTGLLNGLDKASVITEAQKQGGHYNDTAYSAQLTALTKQLRAQYPGYRDYIDQHVSEASGIPIANAYVKNLIEDVNKQAAGNKSEQEKIQTYIRSNNDLQGADQVYANYTAGKINANQVMTWANSQLSDKHELEMKSLRASVNTGDKKADTDAVTDYTQSAIDKQATSYFRTNKLTNGMTPAQMADTITDYHAHPEKVDSATAQIMGQQYEAARADATNKIMMKMMTPGADGKSVMDKLGATAVKQKVDDTIGALFDASSKMVFNKDFGAAHMTQTLADAIVSDEGLKGILQTNIGKETAKVVWFSKNAPQLSQQIFSNMNELGFGSRLYNTVASQTLSAVNQPSTSNKGNYGPAYTFSKSIDEQQSVADQGTNITGGIKKLSELTNVITAPDKQANETLKANLFKYFYDPQNMDVLAKLDEGHYDPSQKRWIQGREAAYTALTSSDITDQAYAMKNKGRADIWDNYKNWAIHEAGVHILPNNVSNLNDLVDKPNSAHIGWNNISHHIELTNPDGTALSGLQATSLNMSYRSVTNINQALDNLQKIAAKEGGNVDAYLYKALAASVPGGASSKIMQALITANGGNKPAASAPVSQ